MAHKFYDDVELHGKVTSAKGIVAGTGLTQNNNNNNKAQTVVGQYNNEDDNAVFIVGSGDSESTKENGLVVTKGGKIKINGIVTGENQEVTLDNIKALQGYTSTKTIEERLTDLGFKSGTIGLPCNSNGSIKYYSPDEDSPDNLYSSTGRNGVFKQGNFVFGRYVYNGTLGNSVNEANGPIYIKSGFKAGSVLFIIDDEFVPNRYSQNVTGVCILNKEDNNADRHHVVYFYINQNGEAIVTGLHISPGSSFYAGQYNIFLNFGYDQRGFDTTQ